MAFDLKGYIREQRKEQGSGQQSAITPSTPSVGGGGVSSGGFDLKGYIRQRDGAGKRQASGNLGATTSPLAELVRKKPVKDTARGLSALGQYAITKGLGDSMEKAVGRVKIEEPKPAERDDAGVRARYAARHPENTGGRVGAATREMNSQKVYLEGAKKELAKAEEAEQAARERVDAERRAAMSPASSHLGGGPAPSAGVPYAAGPQGKAQEGFYTEADKAAEDARKARKQAQRKVADVAASYGSAVDQLETEELRELGSAGIKSKHQKAVADMEAAEAERDAAWATLQELQGRKHGRVVDTALDQARAAYADAQEKYNACRDEAARLNKAYFNLENEEQFKRLGGEETARMTYVQAQELLEDLDTIKKALRPPTSYNGMDTHWQSQGEQIKKKYGVTDLDALYRSLSEQKAQAVDTLKAQGYDFGRMSDYELDQRQAAVAQRTQAKVQREAEEHPVAMSGLSVVASPFQGLDFVRTALNGIGHSDPTDLGSYRPMSTHDMYATNLVNTIRGTVSREIEDNTDWELWGQNVGSFLYQTGMSGLDSALMVTTLGEGSVFLMGMSAASNTTKDIIERGGSNEQALKGGLAAGAAEMLFEKMSVENLLAEKTGSGWKFWLKETLKQGGIEASEEVFTEIANILSDAAIMGKNSNWDQAVAAYENQGMGREAAEQKAFLDCVSQVAWAGAGGFVSGVSMGGGKLALDAVGQQVNQYQYNQSAQQFQQITQESQKTQERKAHEAVVLGDLTLPKWMGEAGRTGLTNALDTRSEMGMFGELTRDTLAEGYAEVYMAGLNGVELEEGGLPLMASESAERLTAAERMSAYNSGVEDARAKVALNQRKASFATVAGKGKGLVWDSYVEQSVAPEVADRLNEVAKRLNVRVRFVDNILDGDANGQIVEADIRIAKDADQPIMVVFGHEVGHYLETTAPEAYQAIRQFASQHRMEEINGLMELYARKGMERSYDEILGELVNDDIGRMIAEPETLERFIEENKSDRTLLQKVADALRALWQKLTGQDRQQVKTAEEALVAALQSSEAQATKLERAGQVMDFAQDTEGGEYSIKRTRNMDWETQVKGWFTQDGTIKSSDSLYLGESETWLDGVPSAPLYVPGSVMNKATRAPKGSKSGHSLTESELSQIQARIKSAPAVIVNPTRNALIYVTDMEDSHGWPVVAAFNMNNDLYGETAHGATSIYGRESGLAGLFGNLGEDATIFVQNKSKFDALLSGIGKSYPELLAKVKFADETISQRGQEVKGDYSLKTQDRVAALERENAALKAKYEHWKGQTHRSEAGKVSEARVGRFVRGLAQQLGAKVDTKLLTMKTLALYDGIGTGHDADGGDFTFRDASRLSMEIAGELVSQAVDVSDGLYEQYADLRAHLRSTPIVVDADTRASMADYGEWRKRNMGRLRLQHGETGNIDLVYNELSARWPEWFSPEVTAAQDQLERIADTMAYIYTREEFNPYAADMEGVTQAVANELMEQFWDMPGTEATYADRQWRARQELKRQHMEDIRLRVQAERERGKAQQQKLKDWYKSRDAEARAYKAESDERNRLLKVAKRLKNIAKHTDAASRALIQELVGELDTEARHLTGRKLAELNELRRWYEGKTTEGSETYDPDFIPDKATIEALKRLEMKHIDDMDLQDVKDLTDALLHIEHEIRTSKRLVGEQEARSTYQLAEQTIQDLRAVKGSKATGVSGALDKFIVTETLSPIRQVRRMVGYKADSPLLMLTQGLADGQRRMMAYQMEAGKPFERFANDKDFSRRFSGKNAETVKIMGMVAGKGAEVEVTRAMMVSLWLHSQNDQNSLHMKDGGVRVPDMALYRKGKIADAYAAGTVMKVSPSVAKGLWGQMTPTERAFARAVQDYFGKVSQPAINEVSRQLKGYDIAEVENYFPIHTDKTFGRTELETLKFDGTIEGMGFLKERVNHAHSPMMLEDANAVLEQAIKMHGKYVGLAVPVRNFGKVWNVSTAARVEGTQGTSSMGEVGATWSSYGDSVQNAIQAVWGKTGYDYLTKLLTDLQGGGKLTPAWAKTLGKVKSNYAGAVLTLNASVAIKQAASYPTAAAVLGWGPLMRAMGDVGKVDLDLIAKYTPLQWYRSQGYSTKELGDMKAQNKQLPALLNWVQGIDLATTRKLWKASEYYVRENSPRLTVGSDAYYKAVADIYNRVIEETQPNYTTMQRPQLLRSDDTLLGNLAMFKTQPFQNFNILYDAAGEYRATMERAKRGEASRAEIKVARTSLNRAVTSQVAQLGVFAGMTMLWGLFRGKKDKWENDEGEMDPVSVLEGFMKDVGGGAASMVPFGSEGWEFISSKLFGEKYYGMEPVAVESISNTLTALSKLGDVLWGTAQSAIRGEEIDWKNALYQLDDSWDDVSKLLGIPYENVVNLFNGFARWVAIGAKGEYLGEYAALHLTVNAEKDQKAYMDLLFKAWEADQGEFDTLYTQMVRDGFDGKKIKSAMESRMKKAQKVTKVAELDERFVAPEDRAVFDRAMELLEDSELWGRATREQRDKAKGVAYELATGDNETILAKLDKLEEAGIDPGTYALYKLALEMADDANNDNGSYDQDERKEAMDAMGGLTKAERAALWELAGGGKKSNPWG